MSPMQWRKKIIGSSNQRAKKKFALEVGEQAIFRLLALSLWLGTPATALADGNSDQKIAFNIPQKRADLALTEFAKQTNVTLIFPFNDAMDVMTNELVGQYTVAEAVQLLVANTKLNVKMNEQGLLTITTNQSSEESNSMYDKNKLSSAIIGILSTVAAANTLAQTSNTAAPAADNQVDEVMITGIRGSLQRSMDIKRSSEGVVDAISAEDIGKFPDTNVAESLQRITGVSVDRSGGEGQLITVRGFGPDFNTVLVNGRQIATENNTRAFSFDTVASEMVSGLDVHKTSTAALQSGGVGSTINVKTARPFDFKGLKVAGSIQANKEDYRDSTTPSASGLVSNTFNDNKFGVLLSLSHQEREDRLNQAQMDGWLQFNPDPDPNVNTGIPYDQLNGGKGAPKTIFSPRNYDTKVTFEDRKRDNASLVLQYAPSDNLVITADALYSDFDVKTNALSYGHWFTAPNVVNATTDNHGTVIDLYQEVGLATDMHSKKFDRLTNTNLFGLNADWQVNDKLKLTFDASTSTAKLDPNNGRGNQLSLIGYANRVRFQVDNNILPLASGFEAANPNIFSGQQQNVDHTAFRDPSSPDYVAPAGVSDFLDKSNSRAHVMLRRGWGVKDDVDQFKMDGLWDEGKSAGLNKIKFGAQYSSESKDLQYWTNEPSGVHCTYCGYPDAPAIPADMQYVFNAGKDFLSGVSGHGRMPTSWLAHDGEKQFAYLESVSGKSFDAIKSSDFVVDEDTFSFYLEAEFSGELSGMPVSMVSGVRVERTNTSVGGRQGVIKDLKILDQTEMLTEYAGSEAINIDHSDNAILPNMSVKLDLSKDMVLRAAASKTLTRPTLLSLAPVTNIGTTRPGGNLTSTSGNAELKPFESDNFDLSWEWYYGDASYVSAGYFKKNVNNFIVNTVVNKTFTVAGGGLLTDPSTGTNTAAPDAADKVATFKNTIPVNGETASVDGLEVGVQHTFGETGFGVILNATYVNSDAELDPSNVNQTFALTGLSNSMNMVGFYEKGPYQIRLAYNHRDRFVQQLTQTNGDGPMLVDPYKQWDLSASYAIDDHVSVFLDGINLTNEFVHKRGRYENQLLLIEDSGRRWSLGVRANF